MNMVPRSLQAQTAVVIALAFFVFLSLFFVTTYMSIRGSLLARSDSEVRTELTAITAVLRPGLSMEDLARILAGHRAIGESPLQFVILERQGNSFTPLTPEPGKTMPRDVASELEQHPGQPYVYSTSEGDMRLISIMRSVFIVGAAYNTIALEEAEDSIIQVFAGYLAAGLLVGIFGGIFLSRYLIGPIGALANSARKLLDREDASPSRLPISKTILEVSDLARSINNLLDARERALEQQRNFAADAAHELRTPLTVLKGEIEVELRLIDPNSPQIELLRSNLEEIERLISTVQDLLELAEMEAEQKQYAEYEECSLLSAINHAAHRLHPLAEAKGISIILPNHDLTIAAEEKRIIRLIYNLLLNAVQHSNDSRKVEVLLKKSGDGWTLEIVDYGTGIPPERLAHLFERFHRTRNERDSNGGAGLGLAIVKSIADHYGFTLDVQSSEGFGTTVSVKMPML